MKKALLIAAAVGLVASSAPAHAWNLYQSGPSVNQAFGYYSQTVPATWRVPRVPTVPTVPSVSPVRKTPTVPKVPTVPQFIYWWQNR